MEFNGANKYVAMEDILACPEAYQTKYSEPCNDVVEFTVYDLTGAEKFPVVSKEGYVFVGWTADEGATFYDCIKDAELSGKTLKPALFEIKDVAVTPATFAEAVKNAKPGQTLVLAAGTYAEDIELSVPYVTVKGTHEAVLNGTVVISADNVTVDGVKFSGGDAAATVATIAVKSVKNIKILNCYFDRVYGTTNTTTYGNNRRPQIAQFANCTVTNITISGNTFDWSTHSGTYLKMAMAFNNIVDGEISNNKNIGAGTGWYFYWSEGTIKSFGNEFENGTTKGNAKVVSE